MAKKPSSGGKVRSAVSGRYVKKSQAKTNPRETVTERDRPRGGRKKGK